MPVEFNICSPSSALITFSCNSSASTKLVSLPHDFLPSLALLLLCQSMARSSPKTQLQTDSVPEVMLNYILPYLGLIINSWVSVGFIWAILITLANLFLQKGFLLFLWVYEKWWDVMGRAGLYYFGQSGYNTTYFIVIWGIRSEMIIYEWHA